MKVKLISLVVAIGLGAVALPAAGQQCLIVRGGDGHHFRNSMIAGALTGGIGFAAGAASGGAKYDYVDSMNMPETKMKYKGGELQKLQEQHVHIVVVNKKAAPDEVSTARDSCKDYIQQNAKPTASQAAPGNSQKGRVCVGVVTDPNGKETCTAYADAPKQD